ncbi:MAG: PaaI family thioesterase [Hyphomicrobiales bacterium]|nr:PaaI family thioesterase [Hyphomicrobiales bacterium]
MSSEINALMSAKDIMAFWEIEFPQVYDGGRHFHVTSTAHGEANMRMEYAPRFLRPGGTISGPSMFALADLAMYAAVLSAIGPVGLAVTTNLNINFLCRPGPCAMIARARLLKIGSRLAVGDVALYSEGQTDMAAHATSTYSLPPR